LTGQWTNELSIFDLYSHAELLIVCVYLRDRVEGRPGGTSQNRTLWTRRRYRTAASVQLSAIRASLINKYNQKTRSSAVANNPHRAVSVHSLRIW